MNVVLCRSCAAGKSIISELRPQRSCGKLTPETMMSLDTDHTHRAPTDSHNLAGKATLVTVLFAAAALAAPYLAVGQARYWGLVGASAGFLTVAWFSGATNHRYGRWTLAGLILCAAGDILGPWSFVAGSTMFLMAHVLFVVAFWAYGLDYRRCMVALIMLIPGGLLLRWLAPQVDESMRGLIVTYTCVITTMVIAASGTHRWILIGALVFYVSDIFVARWKFVDHDSSNAFFCYPLYYTACLILAHSVRLGTRSTGVSFNRAVPEE